MFNWLATVYAIKNKKQYIMLINDIRKYAYKTKQYNIDACIIHFITVKSLLKSVYKLWYILYMTICSNRYSYYSENKI